MPLKRAKSQQTKTLDSHKSHHPNIFRLIISQIEASQGLKPLCVKRLYNQLSSFSSLQERSVEKGADANGFVVKIGNSEVWVAYNEICRLYDILFKDIYQRFEHLFTVWHKVSESMALGQPSQQTDMCVATDELNLLVRCCLIVLNLPVSQENLLRNGRDLLLILGKLNLLKLGDREKTVMDFEMLLSSECTDSETDLSAFSTDKTAASPTFLQPSNPCVRYLLAIIEVFVDELSLHRKLRKNILLIDSLPHTSKQLFSHLSYHSDIGIVMELITTHFLLSVSNEVKFKDFLCRLLWVQGKKPEAPELSMVTARSLVLNPIMRSAPKLLQAHLLSMLSNSIDASMVTQSSKPDPRLVHCYISAFESSVILYSQYMPWLRKELHSIGEKYSVHQISSCIKTFQLSFESYLEESTKLELDHVISKLNDMWHSEYSSTFLKTENDLVTLGISHIQDRQYILDMACRDEMLSITREMAVRAVDCFHDIQVQPLKESTRMGDICLIASLLKLMSSSLFQALWCLRYSSDSHCSKTLKDSSSMRIINCFEEFSMHLPIQTSLSVMMESCPLKHKELRPMLLHFLGLLSLSFQIGVDFLVKNCMLMIVAMMNLFVFEEGNLNSLRLLTVPGSEVSLPVKPPVNSEEALMDQNSCLAAASNCQNIQNLNLSNSAAESEDMQSENPSSTPVPENPSSTPVPENTEKVPAMEKQVCNGKAFLKSHFNNNADFHDLSDYLEYEERKNYNWWLRNKKQYRTILEREPELRWKKRQKICRSVGDGKET